MSQPSPSLSIITPVLNEASGLAVCLDRLIAIEGEKEIIIVDGGSTDHTCAVAARYPVTLIHSDRGRGKQLATGRDAASGDLLWFIHVDSVIHPQSGKWIRETTASGTRCGCFSLFFHDSTTIGIRVIAYLSNLRARWFRSLYGDQGIFCDAAFYDQIGGFNRELPLMEDIEFSRRARRHTHLQVLPHPIGSSARRFLKGGVWRTFWKMQALKLCYACGMSAETIRKQY